MRATFLVGWGLCSAAALAPPAPGLRAFAIVQVADDDHEKAATMTIDPTTGAIKINPSFPFAASDQSSLDCFIGYSAGNGSYIVSSGPTPDILVVNAGSGKVISSVPMPPSSHGAAWFIQSWAWDEGGAALLLVVANNTGSYLARVHPWTGALDVLSPPLPFTVGSTLPCETALLPSRSWLLLLAPDTQRDDGNDAWDVVDYAASPPAIIHTVQWDTGTHGGINAYTFLPVSSGTDAILAWAKQYSGGAGDGTTAGPTLLLVDAAGGGNVTVLHQWPMTYKEVTATLGCVSVREVTPGAAYRVYVLARDMGTLQQLLFTVDLALTPEGGVGVMLVARGGLGGGAGVSLSVVNTTVTDVTEDGVGGDVYGLVWG